MTEGQKNCYKIHIGIHIRGMQTRVAYYCLTSYLILSLILLICAGYVYRVNARRTADDPQKRDYHPLAVPLSIGWPIIVLLWVLFFIIRAVLYGVFLVLFTVALVFIRKPFLLVWLIKVVNKVGNELLQVNTFLIRLVFPKPKPAPV